METCKRTFDDVQLAFWINLFQKHEEEIKEAKTNSKATYVFKTTAKNADDLMCNNELITEITKQYTQS